MSVELFRRARRAEARAERAEDRRRLRLEFFRQALTQGFDSLKVRHAEGASGQESVRAHARLMDDVIFSLTRLIAVDAARARLDATPLVVVALGGYGRSELHLHAGGAIPRRRPAALRPLPPRAARERLPARLRPVPRDDAGRARPAVSTLRRLAVYRRAERQGVGGR